MSTSKSFAVVGLFTALISTCYVSAATVDRDSPESAFSALWSAKVKYPTSARASLVNGVADPAGLHKRVQLSTTSTAWSTSAEAAIISMLNQKKVGENFANHVRATCRNDICEIVAVFDESHLKTSDASIEQENFRSSILDCSENLGGQPYVVYVGGPNAGPGGRPGVSMLGYIEKK